MEWNAQVGSASPGAPPPPRRRRRWGLHIGLFLATIASTFFVGFLMSADAGQAAGYSAAIITILLVHEMGHFVMCGRYRVPATLPYFIPIPLPPFGTMGAVIRMRGQLRSRRSVFDIGVAGPLAGLAVALPVTYLGLKLSRIVALGDPAIEGGIQLGDSLLFWAMTRAALGTIPPEASVLLHPVGLAGWAGCFITGLNLLPIGQLDGGHILYGMLGTGAQRIGFVFLVALVALTVFFHHGWWPLLILLLYMRPRHPATIDTRPLDDRRMILGLIMMIIFALTFVPQPILTSNP